MPDVQQFCRELTDVSSVGIISHERPDADALGSAFGLAEILESAGVATSTYNVDGVPEYLTFLPRAEQCSVQVDTLRHVDAIAVLDCGFRHRIGRSPDWLWEKPVFIIDHHEKVEPGLAERALHDPAASSTGELVFRIGEELDFAWNTVAASNLFVAIHTDTGGFRYSKTSRETFRAAGILIETGISPDELLQQVYEAQPRRVFELKCEVLANTTFLAEGGLASISISQSSMKTHQIHDDDMLVFVNEIRSVAGVEVAIQFEELPSEQTRVSLRSKSDKDVSKIAEYFGGGGHVRAAGCIVDAPLARAEELVRSKAVALFR
jgi:phosphoesterase RecJ-like protein